MRQWLRPHLTYANVMVTILAFIVLGGMSYAASGGNFILGQSNSASSTTALTRTGANAGKGLQVTNASTSAGATALGLNVASGHTPFTVNSGTKVANLNADKLDGLHSTAFLQSGAAAGGDLSGTYPNPTIQAGAIGTAEHSASMPAVHVTNTVDQSIPASSSTVLAFNSERYDTAAMHDNATNNSRLTAPVNGIYAVTAQVTWGNAGTGLRELTLVKNEGALIAADAPLNVSDQYQEVTTQVRLQAGDFVEATVFQNSAGAVNVAKNDEFSPEFSMTWLAPGP